jgi:hypothetical protein
VWAAFQTSQIRPSTTRKISMLPMEISLPSRLCPGRLLQAALDDLEADD